MIPLNPEAEAQLDALIAHYKTLGRVEASIDLLNALERAKARISEKTGGRDTRFPYPALAKAGRRWTSYRLTTPPVISGVFMRCLTFPTVVEVVRVF